MKQNKNSIRKEKKNKSMENIKLICKDCGKEFDFTVGEQKFYAEKGFAAPIRCKECRDAKKARNAKDDEMKELYSKFKETTIKL